MSQCVCASQRVRRPQRSAVGILDGLAAVDTDAEDKGVREQHFPLALLDEHGLKAECREGKASVDADRVRILDTIGASANLLDATIHGRVAAAGLMRAAAAGGEPMHRHGELCAAQL